MAVTDTQKVDFLWKKLGYGTTKTDTNANKKASNEAIASPLLLRADKVWNQASSIPTVLPGSSSGVVTVHPTGTPIECVMDATATTNRTWKTQQINWVPTEIGSTYQVKVYVHTSGNVGTAASSGTQVFATGSGNNDEWFFDYQSGVLHYIGANLPNGVSFTGKSVYVSGGRYTGALGVGSTTNTVSLDEFNGNNVTTAFTLSQTSTVASAIISINGTIQEVTNAYGISGTTLTFTEAPKTGDKIQVRNFFSSQSITVLGASISDNDNDTKIQVEESSDEDIIRFDIAGSELATISSTGIVSAKFIQFGSYTTTQRNAISAANGMVVYNSTTNKFQGYAGGSWVDLH